MFKRGFMPEQVLQAEKTRVTHTQESISKPLQAYHTVLETLANISTKLFRVPDYQRSVFQAGESLYAQMNADKNLYGSSSISSRFASMLERV